MAAKPLSLRFTQAVVPWELITKGPVAIVIFALRPSSPEILDYRNAKGHGWIFYRCDGVLRRLQHNETPGDDMKVIRQVQNFQLRDDDIMIVAYAKCGTHWLWEIVTMILRGHAKHSADRKEIAMLGLPVYEKSDSLPSPRVLNSHHYFRHLPAELVKRRIKTIHIMRNPKDVSVSFYHHMAGIKSPNGFEGTYSESLELFLQGKGRWGPFFDYIKDWQQVARDNPDLPILNIFYEDLKKETMKTIQNIATFLDKPVSEILCKEIANACHFSRLKMADHTCKNGCLDDTLRSMWKGDEIKIYRKGEVGDWKNWMTVAQSEIFDDVIKSEMEGTDIKFTYE